MLQDVPLGIHLELVNESFYLPRHLSKIPMTASFLVGVTVFQRMPLPILQINSFLNLAESKRTKTTSVIVIESDSYQVGIWSDMVAGVVNVPEAQIKLPEQPHPYISHLCHTSEQVISILNITPLLDTIRQQLERE